MRLHRLHLVIVGIAVGCSSSPNGPSEDEYSDVGKPSVLPAFDSIGVYAPGSPFNSLVTDRTLHANSPAMISRLAGSPPLVVQVRQYSAPVFFADSNTEPHDVRITCSGSWELGVDTLTGVPIPDWARPAHDADGSSPPEGCGEASEMDNHMIVIDLARRCEWDFWQARRVGGQWYASWATGISLDGNGVYPRGMSTRGSGLAFPAGVIWPDELAAGEIHHALALSYPFTASGGPVSPATDSDGITDGSDTIPEGARLVLDTALNLDALPLSDEERTIARAMQEYGLYMVDTAGESGLGLYAIDPKSVTVDPYAGFLPAEESYLPVGIPLDSLRVLQLGPQDPDYQSNLQVSADPCATFE